MKRQYFTHSTLQSTCKNMLKELELDQRTPRLAFDPTGCALLVLDMQDYFLEPASHAYIPGAEVITPGLQTLVDAFACTNSPIIYTQHTNTPQDAGMMARWWRELITPDHERCGISTHFDLSKGTVIQKSQYDAFHQTRLETILQEQGICQVLICGVMAHLCCETTARSAFMRGFEVFFCVDGMASYNEDFHRSTVRNLAHGFGEPVLVTDILGSFEESGNEFNGKH
jgi:isochorismate hydrolase